MWFSQSLIQIFDDKFQALSFNMPAVLQIALLKIFKCAVGVHFVCNCA